MEVWQIKKTYQRKVELGQCKFKGSGGFIPRGGGGEGVGGEKAEKEGEKIVYNVGSFTVGEMGGP